MRITRPIERGWGHRHPVIHVTGGGGRPIAGVTPGMPQFFRTASTDAGPSYMGVDPSDPLTWPAAKPHRPQPGMIGFLNFDGAALQARTPTGGVQRGSQRRGARGTR
jgi:hypothetical protein